MIVAQVFLEAKRWKAAISSWAHSSWCKPRFSGFAHPRLCKYSPRCASKRAARSFRRRLSAAFRVSLLRPVSTVSGRFSLWLLVLFGLSTEVPFSWLLSVARFFAASSRIARKRRSLSCPVSLARLRAASFRLVPRRFSLCSVVSSSPWSLVVADNFQALFSFLPGLLGQFARFLPCWQINPHNPSELGAPRPATPSSGTGRGTGRVAKH